MMSMGWKRRVGLFAQRFWQPTSACMTCMPGSLGNVFSAVHWSIAVQTGLATGLFALLISFTPAGRLYENRYGNALVVGALTALGDGFSHSGHYGIPYAEAAVTGAVSCLLALAGSFLFEDRARRIRAAWSRLSDLLTALLSLLGARSRQLIGNRLTAKTRSAMEERAKVDEQG